MRAMTEVGLALAMSALAGCSGGGGSGGSGGGGSGGSGGSGSGTHCVEYNKAGTVLVCLGLSSLDSTTTSSENAGCADDGGGAGADGDHAVVASSCPSGTIGCCYTQQSTPGGQVSSFECYYGGLTSAELQSICSDANASIGGTTFTSAPPF
jgi:hypothetical protein